MNKKVASIRGMNDILPEHTALWQWLEKRIRDVLDLYGYREIRMPIVEVTELFKRSIGEVTDIVEKEMYTFADRNGDSLTLRPEGTAGCVRAAEQHGLLYNQIQRLWYQGPMFRHERPQAGRYRQFHQIGVEAFGMQGPDIDAEIILMTARLWHELGLADQVTLEINSLGSAEDRQHYRQALVDYLQRHQEQLDADSRKRLERNPLRVLDSKHEGTRALLSEAPQLADFLGEDSRRHFQQLRTLLDVAGVTYQINPYLVRGLDYYGKTVFEWVTNALGAQGTVCAGGRYDGLVSQLGGRETPAVGFAMGMERLILLLQQNEPALPSAVDVYILADETIDALLLGEQLRDNLPGRRIVSHCGGGSFKRQMKKADQSGAALAIIVGSEERVSNTVSVKPLRGQGEQQRCDRDQLMQRIADLLEAGH